jgi:hypothetical protein
MQYNLLNVHVTLWEHERMQQYNLHRVHVTSWEHEPMQQYNLLNVHVTLWEHARMQQSGRWRPIEMVHKLQHTLGGLE